MGAITDDVAEYATVQRLSKMLCTAKEDYRATESYALFTAILCWVMQRIRVDDGQNEPADECARSVQEYLKNQYISDSPWNVERVGNLSAFDFFMKLRNAVAHGDARSIRPVNRNSILVGHEFLLCERGREHIATVQLERRDMQRLGTSLAKCFCDEMKSVNQDEDIDAKVAELHEEGHQK